LNSDARRPPKHLKKLPKPSQPDLRGYAFQAQGIVSYTTPPVVFPGAAALGIKRASENPGISQPLEFAEPTR